MALDQPVQYRPVEGGRCKSDVTALHAQGRGRGPKCEPLESLFVAAGRATRPPICLRNDDPLVFSATRTPYACLVFAWSRGMVLLAKITHRLTGGCTDAVAWAHDLELVWRAIPHTALTGCRPAQSLRSTHGSGFDASIDETSSSDTGPTWLACQSPVLARHRRLAVSARVRGCVSA